eukprot:259915_1
MSTNPFALITDAQRTLIFNGFIRECHNDHIPNPITDLILLYLKDGVYAILYTNRPLGFSVIMDVNGNNAIIATIQDTNNYKSGMKIASRIIAINNQNVSGVTHKDILTALFLTKLPFYIIFQKRPRTTLMMELKAKQRLKIIKTFEGKICSYDTYNCVSLNKDLEQFFDIAAVGQLFNQHYYEKDSKNVIVKVSFDNGIAKRIFWGRGSRQIYFNDIEYISSGHLTPTFREQKNLDPKICLSIVSKAQTLDISASNEWITKLWVKGLRKCCFISMSDKKSERFAKIYADTLPEYDSTDSYSSSDDDMHVKRHLKGKALYFRN